MHYIAIAVVFYGVDNKHFGLYIKDKEGHLKAEDVTAWYCHSVHDKRGNINALNLLSHVKMDCPSLHG